MNMDLLATGIAVLLVAVGGCAALSAFRLMLLRQQGSTVADWSQGSASLAGFYLLMPWLLPSKKITYTYRKPGFTVLLGVYGLFSLAEAVGGGIWLSQLPVKEVLTKFPESAFGPTALALLALVAFAVVFIYVKSFVIGTLNHWEKPVEA